MKDIKIKYWKQYKITDYTEGEKQIREYDPPIEYLDSVELNKEELNES